MALTTITTAGITAAAVTEPKLAISGTASSSVWLRGDMAWSTIPGDIEAVVAGTGLSGGGTSGSVTLNVEAAQTQITSLGTIASLVATTADINAGTFDGIVGGTTPADGSFTTLSASTSITGTLATAAQANITSLGTIVSLVATTADINAGTFDGIVGGTTPADGSFTTLSTTGTTSMNDGILSRPEMKDYSETKTALSAAASVTVDIVNGNVFTLTADQNTTFVFSNPSPTGKSCAFTLIWTQDSSDRTITWPATVDWAGGSAPDVTSGSGKIDVYTFFTMDAGTIWYGFQAGADMG